MKEFIQEKGMPDAANDEEEPVLTMLQDGF